jgi:hypothetical protein
MRDCIGGDRRGSSRTEAELPVRFVWDDRGTSHISHGVTAQIGRRGVLLYTNDPPPLQAAVDLYIEWPYLLQGICPLELVMSGRVLRLDGVAVVVVTHRYQFRTRGERSFEEKGGYPKASLIA